MSQVKASLKREHEARVFLVGPKKIIKYGDSTAIILGKPFKPFIGKLADLELRILDFPEKREEESKVD